VDSNNQKDRGHQCSCRDPTRIHCTIGHHRVGRTRVVSYVGSIRLSSSVYRTIYVEVILLIYISLHFASNNEIFSAAVHSEDNVDISRFTVLFILHPRTCRRDVVAPQGLVTNDQ
jgi:hypothetical protein